MFLWGCFLVAGVLFDVYYMTLCQFGQLCLWLVDVILNCWTLWLGFWFELFLDAELFICCKISFELVRQLSFLNFYAGIFCKIVFLSYLCTVICTRIRYSAGGIYRYAYKYFHSRQSVWDIFFRSLVTYKKMKSRAFENYNSCIRNVEGKRGRNSSGFSKVAVNQ